MDRLGPKEMDRVACGACGIYNECNHDEKDRRLESQDGICPGVKLYMVKAGSTHDTW